MPPKEWQKIDELLIRLPSFTVTPRGCTIEGFNVHGMTSQYQYKAFALIFQSIGKHSWFESHELYHHAFDAIHGPWQLSTEDSIHSLI